jgi:hypothetical protein
MGNCCPDEPIITLTFRYRIPPGGQEYCSGPKMAHIPAMGAEHDFLPAGLKERASALAQQWRDFCSSRSAALVSFLVLPISEILFDHFTCRHLLKMYLRSN